MTSGDRNRARLRAAARWQCVMGAVLMLPLIVGGMPASFRLINNFRWRDALLVLVFTAVGCCGMYMWHAATDRLDEIG